MVEYTSIYGVEIIAHFKNLILLGKWFSWGGGIPWTVVTWNTKMRKKIKKT